MQAIGKYIVIKKINEEYKTDSGLLLSSADVESFRYHKGKVINPGNRVEVIKEGEILTNKIVSVGLKDHSNAYVSECKM